MSEKLRLSAEVVKLLLLAEKLADRFEQESPKSNGPEQLSRTAPLPNVRGLFKIRLLYEEDRKLLYRVRKQIEDVVRAAQHSVRGEIGLSVSEEKRGSKSSKFVNKIIDRHWVSDEAASRLKRDRPH
jgi:hypothetical protein